VCAGLLEHPIRETLDGRFLKGTVEKALHVAHRKVEELRGELVQVDDDPHPDQNNELGHIAHT
jgi:hypothetical protein